MMEIHAFRLYPAQDLKREIQIYLQNKKITAGWIMTCVGSLQRTNIRFADQQAGAVYDGPSEIISMAGTVSVNGVHLHLSVSDANGRTIGGHLLEGNIIRTTAEIVIGATKALEFYRVEDKDTGWQELVVRTKEPGSNE
jgi:predicted DNA-binding protein with PD1-like motif